MESKNSSIATGIIAIIVGVIIGGLVGYSAGHMNKDNTTSTSSNVAAVSPNTDGVTVGGAKMVSSKDIVDNAVNAKNVTTLVTAVKAADLVATLKSPGPFTVFAPDNDAFNKLPKGTVTTLLEPANKATLVKILTYHVVPGTYTTAALRVMATKGETLTSVEGEVLTPVVNGNTVEIQDANGGVSKIVTPDVISSNGVTHVVGSVLMPKQ
jgi:uncharacterized surface protein with fasciclin (FAS1) repeats